ncbi:MAG: type I-B CRISPR-associated protein Cas7/Csh2, partial [Candidatus Nanohaloarchaea archaeon]
DESESKPDEELRDIRDLTVAIDDFVDRIENEGERIEEIRTVASDVMRFSHQGELGGPEILYEALRDAIGDEKVEVIDIYDEYQATLPEQDR